MVVDAFVSKLSKTLKLDFPESVGVLANLLRAFAQDIRYSLLNFVSCHSFLKNMAAIVDEPANDYEPKNIMITGGAGFIASHVVIL